MDVPARGVGGGGVTAGEGGGRASSPVGDEQKHQVGSRSVAGGITRRGRGGAGDGSAGVFFCFWRMEVCGGNQRNHEAQS